MSLVRFSLVVAFVSVSQTSCFMPTALPTAISEEVPKAETQSIREGETSKEDLRAMFGEPDWNSADGSRWIYEMRQYFAWGWELCLAYAGQGGCGEVGERPIKIEYLDIRFVASGAVSNWSTHSVRLGECIDDVACLGAKNQAVNATKPYQPFGPGVDSPEFLAAVGAAAGSDVLAISKPAYWYEDSIGYDDILRSAAEHVEGVLAVTEFDVVFFVWSGVDYVPSNTIRREEIQDVVVEVMGKSRCLILVTEAEHHTFEITGNSRKFVDVDSTESIAEILAQTLNP